MSENVSFLATDFSNLAGEMKNFEEVRNKKINIGALMKIIYHF